MIPFSGLSRFCGYFGGDGPSPLNWDTTVLTPIDHTLVDHIASNICSNAYRDVILLNIFTFAVELVGR